MRIEQAGRPHRPLATRTRQGPGVFALPGEVTLEQAGSSEAPAPAVSVGPTLACDAAPAPPSDAQVNEAAAQHGGAMLKALEGLQLAALAPDDGRARSKLALLASGLQRAADPKLDALLQAIAARAAVALARAG